MNILIITTHLNPGGIASYVVSLAKGLKKKNHSIFIASSGGEWVETLKKEKIKHFDIDIATKSDLSPKILFCLKKLSKIIRENKIQIIHAQTRVTQVLSFWLYKFYGIPYVCTCHGFFRPRFHRIIFPCWGKKVIAISQAVRRHLSEDLKVKYEDIELIYNGLDMRDYPEYTQSQIDDYKKWIGLGDGPVIGNIARLSTVKGQNHLIAAMKDVVARFPSAQLLFIGDGKIKQDLINQAHDLELSNNIFFIPSVDQTASVLAVMDVFVMSSLQEGLGLSIMEAQAMGLAVIATFVGGIPELIEDNKTGILIPPQDPEIIAKAIISLLENKQRAKQLGENAKRSIRDNFSLDKMSNETEKLYRSVIS
ncbi:MAG: glycosyltransferase family 4 protein [Candidatus Omnitrophota bacterium]